MTRVHRTAAHITAAGDSSQHQEASMSLRPPTTSKSRQRAGRRHNYQRLAAKQQTTVGGRLWCLILLCCSCWLLACSSMIGDRFSAPTMVAAAAAPAAAAATADLPTTESQATTSNSDQQQQQQQASGCDLLFMASDNLADYCHCKDTELMPELGGGGAGLEPPKPDNNSPRRLAVGAQINQLSCLPHNFSQLVRDLSALQQSASSSSSSSITFQVDYLDIRTNFTQSTLPPSATANIDQARQAKARPTALPAAPADRKQPQRCLIIDHISLQLLTTTTTGPARTAADEARSSQQSRSQAVALASSSAAVSALEEQMIDFVGLINETHLQFLSIFLEDNKSEGAFAVEQPVFSSSGSLPRARSGVGSDDDDDNNNDSEDIPESPLPDGELAGAVAAAAAAAGEQETQIKFGRLLAGLSGLSRLELSSNAKPFGSLSLDSEVFKSQTKLKWLNLASNRQVKFGRSVVLGASASAKAGNNKSPFVSCGLNLEYLSLESSSLDRFPLFSLFSIPFKVNGKTQYGLPNLTSLNLANNKLASLEKDLFAHFQLQAENLSSNHEAPTTNSMIGTACSSGRASNKHDKNFMMFILPALTQLDLSNNKLSDLTFKVGQYLLCTMPNLNQLYLQRNRIVHLNLNSLLAHPFLAPDSISTNEATADEANGRRPDSAVRTSRLEYIDLSHNKLRRITAFQSKPPNSMTNITPNDNDDNPVVRVKSINLGHNLLRSAPLVTLLDSQLIRTVLFKESFDFCESSARASNNSNDEQRLASNSLEDLEEIFQLSPAESSNSSMTICDFLAPTKRSKHAAMTTTNGDDNDDLLNEVILANNRLDQLTAKELSSQQCKNIQILTLSNNRISSIEEEALFALRQLEQLDLSQNLLTTFSSEATFIKNVRLRVLNLSKNRINLLNRNVFLHLLELEELSLNENELFALPNELFLQNNRLNYIDLSRNKFTHLDDSLFSHLKQLKVLNLSGNQLKRFSHSLFLWSSLRNNNNNNMNVSTAFQGQSQSNYHDDRQLSQNNNKSSLMSGKRSNNLKSSQKLRSSSNRRQNRQSRQIADDSNNEVAANVLILASNQIDSFNFGERVQFAQNIQLLWLSDNQLKELTPTAFKCLPSVQRLYLRSNRIRSVHESAFSSMKQLEYIDLSENQLGRIQPSTFASSELLRHVDLSSNILTQLDLMDSFARKPTQGDQSVIQIENLNFSNNPKLKINLADLMTFLLSHSSTIRQLNLANIWQIKQPSQTSVAANSNPLPNVDPQIRLDSLDLSSIQSIDDQMFNDPNGSSAAVSAERLDLSFTLANLDFAQRPNFGKKLSSYSAYHMENHLVELNLGNNQLGNEPITQLLSNQGGQNRLVDLNLTSNRIEFWPFDQKIASRLIRLRSLDLSRNKMRHFIKEAAEIGSYRFAELESLILSSNVLISLVEYQAHYQMKKLSMLMPKLKTIDLSYNRLTWIPAQLFADLNDLTTLKLNHNQLETVPTVIATNHRLMLDLSFNFKLRTGGSDIADASQQRRGHQARRVLATELDDYELVLYESQVGSDRHARVACQHIGDFVSSQQQQQQQQQLRPADNELSFAHAYQSDPTQIRAIESQDEDRTSGGSGERCRRFTSVTDSIRLDSVSSSINLATINSFETNNFIHLSLSNNGLTKLETRISDDKSAARMITGQIIILNLSQNKIQNLTESSICRDLTELRSLDLSNNHLKHYPFEELENCSKLAYLDLSQNKMSSLIYNTTSKNIKIGDRRWTSSLLVLKLNQNALTDLNGLSARDLSSLRLLDLRYNLLKSDRMLPLLSSSQSVACIIASDIRPKETRTADVNQKPILRLDDKSLSIVWPKTEDLRRKRKDYYSQIVDFDNKNLAVQFDDDGLSIKFCTFDQNSLTQLCFKTQSDSNISRSAEHWSPPNRCFYVKSPKNIPSCLTNLLEPTKSSISFRLNATSEEQHPVQLISSNSRMTSAGSDRANASNQDPVLSLIDALKASWLKLKQVDLNEYLFSIAKGDTIWIGDKYQIQTLTILKVVIVVGSMCIVALLISVFRSLIRQKEHQSPKSSSELTNSTNTDTEVSHNSSLANCKSSLSCSGSNSSALQGSKKLDSETTQATNATGSSINSGSHSSSRDDTTTNQQTVMERKIMIHVHDRLDANQLMLQQQHPQACSTPSSSLAASSVETAETMQAIDSIQSGSSNLAHFGGGTGGTGGGFNASVSGSDVLANIGSVDQYTESHHASRLCDSVAQQQQQPPQKVATVMRMVKSSSANFDYNGGQQQSMSQTNHHQSANGQTYGTLNPRYSNYLTLKSKLRAIQERQQHKQQNLLFVQEPPRAQQQQHQIQEPPPLEGYYNPNEQLQQHQPYESFSTNCAQAQYGHLAGGFASQPRLAEDYTSNNSHHQMSLANFAEQQPTTMSLLSINTTLSGATCSNLRSLAESSQQVSPASTTPGGGDLLVAPPAAVSAQQQQNLCHYHRLARGQNGDSMVSGAILEQEEEHYQQQGSDLMLIGNLPPPPPSSRAIEALENPSLIPRHLQYS